MIWHSADIKSVLSELEVTAENGLSNGTVDLRLKKYGKNIIRNIEKPSFKKHFLLQLRNKYVYILSVIAIISFIFSLVYQKTDYFSPLLIILIVLLNSLITAYQMLRSDAILNIYLNVTSGIVVNEKVIERRVNEKLPFMATENIMMESVKRGGDRQQLHEIIRVHSHNAARRVKQEGKDNNLIELLSEDINIPMSKDEILSTLSPENFIGRSVSQVEEFLSNNVDPLLKRLYTDEIKSELSV